MKKLITSFICVVLFSTGTYAQNLITNPGFEADVATYTVVENTANVLMRVDAITATSTQAANPTASVITVPAGMWVKKGANSGYIKGVVTTASYNSGASSLNLKITPGTTQTGLTSWYNCVALQKIATPLNNNKKYKASVWARLDDTTPNASVNIYLFLTDNTAKINITKTIALTGGTTWTKYETTFDIPTHITTNPTANFATAFFGAGMTTTYDGTSKTNYSGLLIDDFTLEEDISTGLNTNNIHSQISVKNGQITIGGLEANQPISIYNITGKKVVDTTAKNSAISVKLSKGIYIVKTNNTNTKVVIN